MQITATPISMTEAEALKVAHGGGNVVGKALYGKKDITLRLMYLESREVIFNLTYQPAPLMRWLGKKTSDRPAQKIRMMVEGTRCTASYSGEPIKTVDIEVDNEEAVQKTEFSDQEIVQTAKRMAVRMVRRQIGQVPFAELYAMRSIYRPYYVAFYGELKMGTRVRYLPIPADGNRVERAL